MGGSSSGTVVQSPTSPAPNVSDTAEQTYQSRLQYDPQVAAMEQRLREQYYPQQTALEAALYNQYAPSVAQTQFDIQRQIAPQEMALRSELYPKQTQLIEAMAGQALERMNNPYGYSEDEMAALGDIRDRQRQAAVQGLRERANLGGGLYGGRAASREEQALKELEQGFAQEDIGRKLAASQQALQYATPIAQILYPQIQSPGMPQTLQQPVTQSVTPSADTLYNAIYQASRPQYFYDSGTLGGTNLGIFGRWGGATR